MINATTTGHKIEKSTGSLYELQSSIVGRKEHTGREIV